MLLLTNYTQIGAKFWEVRGFTAASTVCDEAAGLQSLARRQRCDCCWADEGAYIATPGSAGLQYSTSANTIQCVHMDWSYAVPAAEGVAGVLGGKLAGCSRLALTSGTHISLPWLSRLWGSPPPATRIPSYAWGSHHAVDTAMMLRHTAAHPAIRFPTHPHTTGDLRRARCRPHRYLPW